MASTPSTSSTLDNHASPAGSTLCTSISSASSQHGDDGSISAVNRVVSCRWGDCRKTYDDPEDLYHHLCNDHVGRKSTNNLCLSCKWEGCDVTCAKRDHITSHLRVHTPLKPHSCDACGKLFKRPQDLKKHERIHTEQHFQARQLKYQPPTMGMPSGMPFGMHGYSMQPMPAAAAAAAAAAASHGSGWSHYSHNAQPSGVPSYNSNYMYPSLPGHRSQSLGNSSGPGFYPMVSPRHPAHLQPNYPHTPAQGDAASNNSLSPLSSHLGTPSGSGSSPASQQYYKQQAGGERSYLGMQPSRPKAEDDPNSYSYLSQGSSLAGSKRSHDATASFLDDVRRKRMAPTYDEGMAERIDDSFAHGIDDASLEAILTSLGFSDPAQAAAAQQQQQSMQVPSQSQAANRANMSLPDALKTTDLAELNAFLLQVGASASRGMGQEQSTPNTTTPTAAPTSGSEFDFQSALAAAGLDSIPGLDENLFRSLSEPDISYTSSSNPANIGQSLNRPIAQLPHRASTGTTSSQSPFNPMTTSFDSVRVPRGQPYVPQLGVKDMSTPLYRHVEPLMRAAPTSLAERSTSAPLRSTAGKDGSDGNDSDEAMEEGGDEHTSAEPLRPATAKSPVDTGRSLYSRIPRPDPARRLPMPSLGSVASASRDWRESHASHVHPASRSPSPPPTSHSSRQRRMSSSSSSTETSSSAGTGLYPRLAPLSRNATRDGSMEGIATDVAALDVAGSAAASEHGSDDSAPAPALSAAERRQKHVQAILHLLVALNRRRPERKGSDGSEDSLTPPAAGQPARSAHEDAAALPSIRNLLHDVDSREAAGPTSARSHELLGAGGRRIMDIDV